MQKYVLNINIIIIFHTCDAFRKHYVTPLVIVLIVAFGENFNSLSLPPSLRSQRAARSFAFAAFPPSAFAVRTSPSRRLHEVAAANYLQTI